MRAGRISGGQHVLAAIALSGVGSACVARAPACPSSLGQTAEPLVLVVSSTVACKPDDPSLGFIGDEAVQLASTLRQLSPSTAVREVRDPDPTCLQRALAEARGALTVIYTGHGDLRDARSGVCLGGGRWTPVETLVAASGAPYATFLINACRSAEIALRRANVVAIAASPDDVKNPHAETVVGQWLLKAFRDEIEKPGAVDLDNNGVIDSGELFGILNRAVSGNDPVIPKLQSQAWIRVPVIRRAGGVVSADLPSWLQTGERDFREGRAAPPIDEPLTLWTIPPDLSAISPGKVVHLLPAEEARAIAAASLIVLPIAVSLERGRLVARNLRTQEILWWRESSAGGTLLRDADVDEILWGRDERDDPRRYVRPLRQAEWNELDRSGWRPRSCNEPTGKCFVRDQRVESQ